MAWAEIRGRRQVVDTPQYIDYIITFWGTYGTDTIPACGSTYSGVAGSGSLGSTGLDAEPSAIEVSEITRATKLKGNITVRFRGHYTV